MLPLALSNSSAARCFISREKLRKASCNTQTFTIIAYPHYFYLLSNNISHMEDSSLSSTWALLNVSPFSLVYLWKLPKPNTTVKELWKKDEKITVFLVVSLLPVKGIYEYWIWKFKILVLYKKQGIFGK